MDWTTAIDRNREALKRVLAGLLVMAGLTPNDREERVTDRPTAACPLPIAATLPRTLHRAILRLLRPAEAAARRLVIVAARGLVVEVRRPGSPVPRSAVGISAQVATTEPPPLTPPHKREGVASVSESPSPLWGGVRGGGIPGAVVRNQGKKPAAIGFRLFDPPSRWGRTRKRIRQVCVPRIAFPGLTALSPIRQPPMPFDPIDTTPLARRLAALTRALDDLPKQAQRFARWQARRDAAIYPPPCGGEGPVRIANSSYRRHDERSRTPGRCEAPGTRPGGWKGRVWPLRPGRPPGRHSPRDRRPAHEVHDILDVVHGLAIWALEPADTS